MARITHVMAEFVGDMDRYEFVRSNTYPIQITQTLFGHLIVDVCHGYEWKHYDGYRHSFRDLHDLLHTWKIITLEHPNRDTHGFRQVPDPREPTIIM